MVTKKEIAEFIEKEESILSQYHKDALKNHNFGNHQYYSGALMELQFFKEFLGYEERE